MSEEIKTTDGYAVDGDDTHWTVSCPTCETEINYSGFFDSGELNECPNCKTEFKIRKVWIDEDHFIK